MRNFVRTACYTIASLDLLGSVVFLISPTIFCCVLLIYV